MQDLLNLLQADPNAANALGALASAAAAFLALVVSFLSVAVSLWALHVQRRHNVLSIRPLPEVTVADFENSLRVKIRNNGAGPMIVSSVAVSDKHETKDSIVEWMPALHAGRPWSTFSHSLKSRTLLAGGEMVLLELTQYEGERDFARSRDPVRKALSELTVKVTYTDVSCLLERPYMVRPR
jgi:hypothetical protein